MIEELKEQWLLQLRDSAEGMKRGSGAAYSDNYQAIKALCKLKHLEEYSEAKAD
jgi:hypothetical protein